MTRVLHIVEPFLRNNEVRIYSQIMETPDCTPAVLFSSRENASVFPAPGCQLFLDRTQQEPRTRRSRMSNWLFATAQIDGFNTDRAIRNWKPDLVHAHYGATAFQWLNLCRKMEVPLLTSFYGSDAWQLPVKDPAWVSRYATLFRESAFLLVEGSAMQQRLVDLGCPLAKVRIVRTGAAMENPLFTPTPFAPPLKVLMTGRFLPRKGFEDGLAACIRAIHRGLDLEVTIAGEPEPGLLESRVLEETLRAMTADEDVSPRIKFLPNVTPAQKDDLFKTHNVYLCPSKVAPDGDAEGGYPPDLPSAMANGLLSIGTRHCDITELIHHDETGMLAESGDVSGMADLLESALTDPKIVNRIRQTGHKHVAEHYSLDAQLQALRKVYDEALNPPSSQRSARH